jgi:hypothetical protein
MLKTSFIARNWMMNKTKMKRWKSAVRTWESNEKKNKPQQEVKRIIQ